jgi:hypothetical protein
MSNGTPSGELPYGTTSTAMTIQTNESATCKYGTSDVAYASLPSTFTTTGGTAHSQTLTGLTNGTAYAYYVRCMDTSSNVDTASAAITFNVSGTVPPSTLLFSESFENNSYSGRGWYDNTDQGTIVSGGQVGNCLQWAWISGQTQPTKGGATRRQFTPSDELYITYYVKFQTGWRGSQKLYHPHFFHILRDRKSVV